ncbi:hypothetical protein DSO57_1012112 [Entomophthora muscae]|uniref:Uncharacterized protein n=1 Tax=Entomophthora muscae TaxID=34485 RepID=A0ACC2SJA0_9FUNG|nr:hypothetical protein DSO57_1012112 [Entomophthora muscae]
MGDLGSAPALIPALRGSKGDLEIAPGDMAAADCCWQPEFDLTMARLLINLGADHHLW